MNQQSPPPLDRQPASGFLALSVRYQMAWTEIATRIAQRQNALYLYILISGAILGYAGQGIFVERAAASPITPLLALFGVPFVSIIFAVLNRKHEGTIRVLRDFLAQCEQATDDPKSDLGADAYHYNSSKRFRKRADGYRNYHDHVFAVSIVSTAVAALGIAWHRYWTLDEQTRKIAGEGAGFVVYAIVVLALVGLAVAIIYWPFKDDDD